MGQVRTHSGPQELLVEKLDCDIVRLTLNRPEARNTVSFAMWERFSQVLDEIEQGTPPSAIVICGAKDYFSNGGDVKLPPSRGKGALALAARLEMGQRIIRRVRALPTPTIAAIEGGAFGVSWSLALACDIVIAAEDARFGAPFLQFGLVPDGGSSWFLTRRLGRAIAAEIIFSGRTIEAKEAFSLGLVSRVVPKGTAVDQAIAFASDIGGGNRHAVELTKRLIQQAEEGDLAGNHTLELAYCHICQAGEEVPRARELFKQRAAARAAVKARES